MHIPGSDHRRSVGWKVRYAGIFRRAGPSQPAHLAPRAPKFLLADIDQEAQVRKSFAALAAAAALTFGGAVATAPAAPTVHPQAQAACKSARIGGARKCIAAGQFCARRYERDYRRYGYTCSKRDRRGNWHLTYA
jgi:hypothetical protein